MEQVNDTQMKCCFHKEEYVTYLCIDVNCKESTRLLCGDCAIFIPYHKDHIHNIVKLKNIQQSIDGSSLSLLKNAILSSSSVIPNTQDVENRRFMSVNQVNLYFDLIEKQIIEEIARVRKRVISLVDMQDNVLLDVNKQMIELESCITNLFDKQSSPSFNLPYTSQEDQDNDFLSSKDHKNLTAFRINTSYNCLQNLSSQNSLTNQNSTDWQNQLLTPEMNKIIQSTPSSSNIPMNLYNNQNNFIFPPIGGKSQESQNSQQGFQTYQNLSNECDISREISYQLNRIYDSSSEQMIELEILMKQQLKKCELNLSRFSEELNSFLSSYLPRKQMLEFNSINKMLDNRFGFEMSNGELQLLDPAEFYQGMGYRHCIAVNSTENLSLLRRASTLICHQSADEEELTKQEYNKQGIAQSQFETKRQYLFSVFLDNKSLNDINILPLSGEIARLSYIENIHLDFDGNMISSIGYQSLFNSLKQFNSLKHIDLRFNNNYSFDEETIVLLSDVLNTHKSTLRVLCLTMRSLRQRKTVNLPALYNSNSSPNTNYSTPQNLDSSSSSSTTSYSSSSTYFYSMEHPERNHNSTIGFDNNCQKFQFGDALNILLETIGNLSNLEVLYLDVSHNNIKAIAGQEAFAPIYTLKKLEMIHFVFNRTHLPNEEILQIIHNLYKNTNTLKYFKLFLKENNYTFQQQRHISGQFQKIKAKTKNFDLFY